MERVGERRMRVYRVIEDAEAADLGGSTWFGLREGGICL